MSQIFIVGDTDFTLGFHLTGIKNIVNVMQDKEIERTFSQLLDDSRVGIIVTDEKTISKLPIHFRKKIENSVKPITVVLAENGSGQDNLRDMVKRSIGVDLWRKK